MTQAPVQATTPGQSAIDSAMASYRAAIAQMQQTTPSVDTAAIYAPYRASETVAGQLGTGLQTAEQNAGAAAQQQYATGRDAAQKAAAQFGIAAAGAPTALQDNGTGQLAAQTQAYATAAPQAAAQWQQLLERTAAGKVADATVARQNLLASGEASLAGALPSSIQAQETLANQQAASQANNAYLRSSLSQKGQQAYDSNILKQEGIKAGITKTKLTQSGANSRSAASIAAANSRSANSIAAANERSTAALAAKQRTATAKGVKGISALNAALKTTSTAGAKKVTGYTVSFASDPNGVNAGAPPIVRTVKSIAAAKPPPGYLPLGPNDTGKPITSTAASTPGSLSLAKWNQLFSQLKAANRGAGIPDSQLLPLMPTRPKK